MADLSRCLHAERDALISFVALLETEQQALIGANTEKLVALSDSKIQAANELGKLAVERKNELNTCGASEGAGSATAWLKSNALELLPIWQSIQQLAGKAQQMNRTNGILIQSRLRHNQQALMALQNAARTTSGLYGPDGQPHLETSGRILGSG